MLRRETDNGWILIPQYDHGLLARDVMKYWGSEGLYRPRDFKEVMFAVCEHDNGWREWDSHPRTNPENRYPADFTEMTSEEQASIWSGCFTAHGQSHPYAAGLIALHFSLFNEKNLQRSPNDTHALQSRSEIKDFVLRTLDIEFSALELVNLPEPVKSDLRIVQIGDIISLALCQGWKSFTIDNVPKNKRQDSLKMELSSSDGFNYALDPYPFTEPRIELSITGKRLAGSEFENDGELLNALKDFSVERLDFTISIA